MNRRELLQLLALNTMSIYAPAKTALPITAMPAAVYTAIADPEVTYYKVPRGRYTLANVGGYGFYVENRSNLDLDFNGSAIFFTTTGYPFFFKSVVDAFVDALSPTRNASHLTGTITAGTTQLTMDALEIMDVTPGERVTIVAGTDTSDPVEPQKYIVAEVLSVSGQTITFTEPLGVNITVYPNEAALQALVAPSLWFKIGPWGEDQDGANYHKGLGTDHGLLRYVGGRSHDITIRNFHLENTFPADASFPVGTQYFFFTDVDHVTIRNFSVMNVPAALVHTFRCNDVLIDRGKIRGIGRAGIWNTGTTHAGVLTTAWGGDRLTYRNLDVNCRNLQLAYHEVNPTDVLFQNLNYNVDFVWDWSYANAAVGMTFWGGFPARLENSRLDVSGALTDWTYNNGGAVINFENLVIPGVFTQFFPFNDGKTFEGTISVNGVSYGPLASDTEAKTLGSSGSVQTIAFPKGFYKSISFRVTTQGGGYDLFDIHDNHNAAMTSGAWTGVSQNWFQVTPNTDPVSSYFPNLNFYARVSGSAMTIEFQIQYYPAPDDPGWLVS